MVKKINSILNEVLELAKPSADELKVVERMLKNFLDEVSVKVKEFGYDVEIFVGGSYAKKTMIRKDKYDIDVFLRFGKKHKVDDLSELTEKVVEGMESMVKIHGSRDYFRAELMPGMFAELIPVLKITRPEQAQNITDLSFSHVKYINRKMKGKVLDEVLLAKAFCHANHCYGAESHIGGFSGYALELLVLKYGSFEKLCKAMVKVGGKEKVVIDIERQFKNKSRVFLDLNESKLESPIILIDPTNKYRNALAALSQETLERFSLACKDFLKNPAVSAFEVKKTDLDAIRAAAKKAKRDFVLLQAKTQKQAGDVAGSKLQKFYRHMAYEAGKYFKIIDKGFNYNDGQSARFFFVGESRKEIIIDGPTIKDKGHLEAFEARHKDYFIKKDRVYAKEYVDYSLEEFMNKWRKKNVKKIKEMHVSEFRVV